MSVLLQVKNVILLLILVLPHLVKMVLNANNYNKEDSFAAAKRDGKELFVTKISMTAPNNHVLSVLIVLI